MLQTLPRIQKSFAPTVTEEAPKQVVPAQPVDIEEVEHQHRALAIARIRLSSAPEELKERLAGMVETTGNAEAVEACLKAVEESLPEFLRHEFLRQGRGEGARVGHPAGDVFFRGTTEEVTDAEARKWRTSSFRGADFCGGSG
jgi:hypothetical protein